MTPRGPTDRTRAKILVEHEIDRLTKERKEFFIFKDYEVFGTPVWSYYAGRIKSHDNRLKVLRDQQRKLYGFR